jgi:hypothetical protein
LIIQIILGQELKIMKLLVIQFPTLSHHFNPLQSKYSSQHPVFKHPQSMFHTSFTPIQNHRQNYSLLHSNFYVFPQQMRRMKVLGRMVASITRIQSPLDFLPN